MIKIMWQKEPRKKLPASGGNIIINTSPCNMYSPCNISLTAEILVCFFFFQR